MLEKQFKVKTVWSQKTESADSGENSKSHKVYINDKPELEVSAAKAFKGDETKYNPEDLFLSALSSCHMMSYMYLCKKYHLTILNYTDETIGKLKVKADGSGAFISVDLHPIVTIKDRSQKALALSLHQKANELCFIANSCNFPISHQAIILVE